MDNKQVVSPSWWYSSIGVVVILAGLGLFFYTLLHGILHVTDNLVQIVVPDERDLNLMPKLSYTIFLESESVVDGRIYSAPSNLSGLACTVTSGASGNKIDTHTPAFNTTYSIGGREGRSVLEFITDEGGVYHISCGYTEGSRGPQVVLAVGSGVAGRIFSTMAKSFASLFGGGILGVSIIVAIVVLRNRSKKQLIHMSQLASTEARTF